MPLTLEQACTPRPSVFDPGVRDTVYNLDDLYTIDAGRFFAENYVTDGMRLFGQLPDTLEDTWVYVALRDDQKAREVIDQVPKVHPFEMRYDRIEKVDWESCSRVLDRQSQLDELRKAW